MKHTKITNKLSGLSFSLSEVLQQKMSTSRNWLQGGAPSFALAHRLSSLNRPAYYVTRCSEGTYAQLSVEGTCSCGPLNLGGSECNGYEENDRTAVCVQDLQRGDGRGWATCGLEFEAQFEPEDCPVGYVRIGVEGRSKKGSKKGKKGSASGAFICQDALSPFSCGPQQTDCSSAPGVLTSLCVDYACEILMCKEGWTFAVNADGGAECRPFKSLAWRPDV